jgi:hypothetical protein
MEKYTNMLLRDEKQTLDEGIVSNVLCRWLKFLDAMLQIECLRRNSVFEIRCFSISSMEPSKSWLLSFLKVLIVHVYASSKNNLAHLSVNLMPLTNFACEEGPFYESWLIMRFQQDSLSPVGNDELQICFEGKPASCLLSQI